MPWHGHDFDAYRRPSPRRMTSDFRRSGAHLSPDFNYAGETEMYRSRSTGARPVPTVMVVNDVVQEARTPSRSPDGRGRRYSGRDLIDELAERVDDRRYSWSRSRSRGRSDAALMLGPGAAAVDRRDLELALAERELNAAKAREMRELDARRLRASWDVQRLREEQKRQQDQEESKREKQRIIDDYELKKREEAERRKEEVEKIKLKLEKEKIEAKEKEDREWKEFLRKQKEKEEKEKEDKRKEKEKMDDAMRKLLAEQGFSHRTIESMLAEKKKEQQQAAPAVGAIDKWSQPIYCRIHRRYLDVTTLKFYRIPYSVSEDGEFLFLHRHLDQYEIDILCEHTRKLRSRDKTLLLEPPKESNWLGQWRKRDRKTGGIKERGILIVKR